MHHKPVGPNARAIAMTQRNSSVKRQCDAEIIAVLLGGPSASLLPQAHQWLKIGGGLSKLVAMSPSEWNRLSGCGPARHARLLAAIELGRRLLERHSIIEAPVFNNPSDAAACFRARLVDLPYEVFACLFLDTRHRHIAFEQLFRGSVDGAAVYPREVLRRALHHNAAALIVGHNHPSGDCAPSEADRRTTEKLRSTLALLDIRLLDHLVVARSGNQSLAQLGWI